MTKFLALGVFIFFFYKENRTPSYYKVLIDLILALRLQ